MLADRGLRLPEFLSIKYDNTGREGKNQIVAKWMSWIQHRGGRCKMGVVSPGIPTMPKISDSQ